jgi:hypothetical protein
VSNKPRSAPGGAAEVGVADNNGASGRPQGALSQAVVWSPRSTSPKAKASSLCLAPNGTLLLQGGRPAAALWRSSIPASAGAPKAAVAPAASKAFVAVISSGGQLRVLDSQCAQVYPSSAAAGAALINVAPSPPQPRRPLQQRSPPAKKTLKKALPAPLPSRLRAGTTVAGPGAASPLSAAAQESDTRCPLRMQEWLLSSAASAAAPTCVAKTVHARP